MSSLGLNGRIFLVGVPRSGTTLLQALLAAHADVTSFTESHLFSRPFTFPPRRLGNLGPRLTKDPTPELRRFLAENDATETAAARWFGPPTPRVLRSRLLMPFRTREVARRLVAVLDGIAADREAPVWLEKTPRHLRALPLLETVCEDGIPTRFVHLVRDGLQTVASLQKASQSWERPYDLPACIRRWNEDLALTAASMDKPNHHVVLYGTLTADPESVLRPLLAALGLDWQEDLTARFGSEAERLTARGEPWKQGVSRPIRSSATADRALDEPQRRAAIAGLRQDLYDSVALRAVGGPGVEAPMRVAADV